jgi:hypothetical protein
VDWDALRHQAKIRRVYQRQAKSALTYLVSRRHPLREKRDAPPFQTIAAMKLLLATPNPFLDNHRTLAKATPRSSA